MLVLLGIGLAYLAYWALRFLPGRMVPESSTPEDLARLREVNAARKTIAQIIGGIVVLLGALVTAWLTVRRVRVAEQQVRLETQGDITDRLSRGIEQLGASSDAGPTAEVRAGAVFTLERVAVESAASFGPILQVLMGYLRTHSPRLLDEKTFTARASLRMDVGAAFLAFERLLSRRAAVRDDLQIVLPQVHYPSANLSGANLSGANLSAASLHGADLGGADLSGADLSGADLSGADLSSCDLSGADINDADLTGATLYDAHLMGAYVRGSDLRGADLGEAHLRGAILVGADLRGAYLRLADLSGAHLRDANLADAIVGWADLSGADFTDATLDGADLLHCAYDEVTRWPAGFKPPPPREPTTIEAPD